MATKSTAWSFGVQRVSRFASSLFCMPLKLGVCMVFVFVRRLVVAPEPRFTV